jgi:putative hydrolase of the HAD superfamily
MLNPEPYTLNPKIKAVLFDLGETLFTFGRVNTGEFFDAGAHLTYEYLKRIGQPVPGFARYRWENLFCIRLRYLWSNISGVDFDSTQLLIRIGRRLGYKLSEQQWQEIAWLWYEPLSEHAAVEPDIRRTLTKLRDMGLKLGIVSNTFLNQTSLDRHLEMFGMLEFFPLRMYSYETSWRKPNVKIFNEAAARLEIPPQNIMFVGDRIDTDIRGALRAGMIPVLKSAYTNAGKIPPEKVRRIEHLSELISLVGSKDGDSHRAA